MKKTLAIIMAAAMLVLPVGAAIERHDRHRPRTDRHNNPTAMIWTPGVESFFSSLGYRVRKGEPFPDTGRYYTLDMSAVSDPVGATVQYIDVYGFYASDGRQRWDHTAMSGAAWAKLDAKEKRDVIESMYNIENGTKGAVFAAANIERPEPARKEKDPLLQANSGPPAHRPGEARFQDRPLTADIGTPAVPPDETLSQDRPLLAKTGDIHPRPHQYRPMTDPEPERPAIAAFTILERTLTQADADNHGNIKAFTWDNRFRIGDEIQITAIGKGNTGREIYIYRGPDRTPAWKKTDNGQYRGTIEHVPAGKSYYIWLWPGQNIEAKIVITRRVTG
jgi:hypothetical protein